MGKKVSAAEWSRRIASWRASGLSQAAWCATNGVSTKTFSHAKKRLEDEMSRDTPGLSAVSSAAQEAVNGFIRLHISDGGDRMAASATLPHAAPSSGVSLLAGGYRIELGLDFDCGVLQRLLATLEGRA